MVIGEEYPGHPNPRPAELEQEDLLDDALHLALPEPTDDVDSPTAALRSFAGRSRHPAIQACRHALRQADRQIRAPLNV